MKDLKIFLAGGGTGGATAPVLAVAEELLAARKAIKFYLVGSNGLEKKMMDELDLPIQYLSIPAGKWRRYFSLRNFSDVFKTFFGFLKSLSLISRYQPDVVFGAGSFVQVPLAWAAFLRRVPVVVHQQDFELLLSTRLVAPAAHAITTSFSYSEKQIPDFSGMFKKIKKSKITLTGNPVRSDVLDGSKAKAQKIFGLNSDYPTVLVMGGSTGSRKINEVVSEAAEELVKYVQVIHINGGKGNHGEIFRHPHYHAYDFLRAEYLKHAYAVADLVICRAGMSTITELSVLGKPAIVIPLPASPQETNAEMLAFTKSAVVVFEEFLNYELLVALVRKVLWNREVLAAITANINNFLPKDAGGKIAKIILKTYEQRSEKK